MSSIAKQKRIEMRKALRIMERTRINNPDKTKYAIVHTYPKEYTHNNERKVIGFGDFLRGSIHLYKLSIILGFQLHIDLSEHPIGKYIVCYEINKQEYGPVHPNMAHYTTWVNSDRSVTKNTILTLFQKSKKLNLFIAEPWLDYYKIDPLLEHEREFIQPYIQPTEFISSKINTFLQGIDRFHIVHIRTGDSSMNIDKSIAFPEIYQINPIQCIQNNLQSITTLPVVVISDSLELKKQCVEQFHFLITDTIPVHSGYINDDMEGTALEFFLMARASIIFNISTYSWGSTFSTMCALIYNIPYVRLTE